MYPFGYSLVDFEFMLDEANTPVPVKDYVSLTQGRSKSKRNITIENKPGYKRLVSYFMFIDSVWIVSPRECEIWISISGICTFSTS